MSSLGRRVRHSFEFESIDNNNQYNIQQSGLAVRLSAFNYSGTYFRRKKASSDGMYRVDGGNIPSDMSSSVTYYPVDLSNGKNPPPPIVCNLNKGNALKDRQLKSYNLSPNNIQEEPCPCTKNPQYDAMVKAGLCTDGSPCQTTTTGTNGATVTTVIPKEIYANCPTADVEFDKFANHKPNFMYMPSYQPSCSTHPRAAGYANEDNYNCLKFNKFGAGDADSTCCDFFCGCFYNQLVAFKLIEFPNPLFTGTPGQVQTGKDGLPIPEKLLSFEPICGKEVSIGFCCNKVWMDALANYNYTQALHLDQECDSNICNFGWHYNATGTQYSLCLCPGLGLGDDGKPDPNFKFESSVQDQLDKLGKITGKKYGPSDFAAQTMEFSRTYLAGGNTDCGCSGLGGTVTMSGSMDCNLCWYFLPESMFTPGYTGGIIAVQEKKCKTKTMDTKTICGCVFTDEVDFGNCGKIYITTLTFPSYVFPNGSILEISDNGAIRARGCGNEFVYSCNDVN